MYSDKNPQNIYGNHLFQNVHPNDIGLNIQPNNFLEIDKGEIIYQVGDNCDSFYLLIKGQIKINFYESSSGSTSLSKFDNDFFGEYEILEKIPRKSTAMTAEKSLLYKLSLDEFKDIIKIKIIYANLNNLETSNAGLRSLPQNNLEESDELKIDEFHSLEASTQESLSSTNSLRKTDDNKENEDDSNWNSSIVEEIKDVFNDEESLDNEEVREFPINYVDRDFDYSADKANSSDQSNQTDEMDKIDQAEESEPLLDTVKQLNNFKNNNDSIIDRIKVDLKSNNTIQLEELTKETSSSIEDLDFSPHNSEESVLVDQDVVLPKNINAEIFPEDKTTPEQSNSNQLSIEEHQELTKKITETIYDEISSPINLIKKYAHLLMHRSSSTEANSILQKIIDQSNYIINSIRAHTTYLDVKLELKSQILQASTVLDDILHLLAGYAEFRNVKLYRKFEADASIMVDKILMYQAFLQIIRFFCENISNKGSIFVTVNRTKDIIFIEFKSTENKIPDELLEKLLEPFTMKDNSGLGLAKRIISEHNGNITANNIRNAGAEIKVFLPIVK